VRATPTARPGASGLTCGTPAHAEAWNCRPFHL